MKNPKILDLTRVQHFVYALLSSKDISYEHEFPAMLLSNSSLEIFLSWSEITLENAVVFIGEYIYVGNV